MAERSDAQTGSLYGLAALYDGSFGMSVKLLVEVLEWSEEELEGFLAQFRAELRMKAIHSYWPT